MNVVYYCISRPLIPSHAPVQFSGRYDTYMWQRSPAELVGGHNDTKQYQSVDFFLPYWLGRYAGGLPSTPSEHSAAVDDNMQNLEGQTTP